MKALTKDLEKWGCDVENALARMADDEEFYEDCLKMFVDDENFEKLGEAIETGDYKAAFDYAHTLKGVAANLGLTPIFDKTSEIVEPLRADDYSDLENQYDAVIKAKEEFIEIIGQNK